jgi:hypothetical protein
MTLSIDFRRCCWLQVAPLITVGELVLGPYQLHCEVSYSKLSSKDKPILRFQDDKPLVPPCVSLPEPWDVDQGQDTIGIVSHGEHQTAPRPERRWPPYPSNEPNEAGDEREQGHRLA